MPPAPEGQSPSMPRPTRPAGGARQRRRLLDAITQVAGERGREHATLRAVVEHAGVSRRTLYELFDDKDDLFLAAADEVAERATAAMVGAYRQAGTPRAGLADAIDALLDFCAAEPPTARVYLVETATAGREGADRWCQHLDDMSQRARCALGRLRADLPAHASLMAVGGVYTVARSRVLAGKARELPQLSPELTRALWATLGID